MQASSPESTLNRIAELVQNREFGEARRLSRALWADLKRDGADPVLRGWARFYDFKCSYELCDYRAAYSLATEAPGVHYAMVTKNVAWMHSVTAEVAMHLGLPHDVVKYARLCFDLRRQSGDAISVAQCAQTACALLGKLHREDLAVPFAHALLDLWHETPAERLLLAGVRFLLAAGPALGPADHRRLASVVPALSALHADAFSAEAIEHLGAIERAPWFEAALSRPDRERRAREKPLLAAAQAGDVAAVTRLLDDGVNANARDLCHRTPLIHAAFHGHDAVVRLLLSRGADPDAENIQRRTALILAADQGHAECVRCLLDAGADRDHEGIHDQTALHVASWQGYVEVVKLLLAAGADVRRRDANGDTALTLSATEDVPEVIGALIAAGAKIDGTTPRGHTPLMKAAMEGRARVVELLSALGADPNRQDRHQLSAADWAEREGHAEIASRLRAAMKEAKTRRRVATTVRVTKRARAAG